MEMLGNEENVYYDRARATMDGTIDYICGEFEKAARYLPRPELVAVSDLGHPSSDAALGLIARLCLIPLKSTTLGFMPSSAKAKQALRD
jgi:hypothetical protein